MCSSDLEAVPRLRDVLADEIVGSVAVVAGHGAVTPFLPRREMLTHDVAVCARRWIVREVRRTLRVSERENSDPGRNAKGERGRNCRTLSGSHSGERTFVNRSLRGGLHTVESRNFQT